MAEDFRSKLRRLRRERGLEPSASEPAGERGLPSWMRARLEREHSLAPPDAHLRRSGAPQRLQRVGELCWRETRFPVQHRHGEWQLAEVDAASGADLALLGGDERLETLDLRGAVYLDIETNGLAGGSGTYAFQVGLGRFDGDEFELWQGFLEDPGRARVLLEDVARRVQAPDCPIVGHDWDQLLSKVADRIAIRHLVLDTCSAGSRRSDLILRSSLRRRHTHRGPGIDNHLQSFPLAAHLRPCANSHGTA